MNISRRLPVLNLQLPNNYSTMSGPFAALTRSIRPTALSAFGLFTTQTLSRPSSSTASLAKCTKFLVRPASEVTPRECPTPLVLLRMKNLGETSMAEE